MDLQFLMEVEALSLALDHLDYFAILRVPQGTGAAEVKAAYYRESRLYHPDRYAAAGNEELRTMVGRIYRRINEAYTVLRDDQKRVRYLADVSGPDRDRKLRFTEAEEQAVQSEQKRKLEEQFGQTPNGRKLYATAMLEVKAGRWEAAERALKSALMYEPANPKFKEALALAQSELEKTRVKGDYRIK
jgi:DnaJ-class molecular chaperone